MSAPGHPATHEVVVYAQTRAQFEAGERWMLSSEQWSVIVGCSEQQNGGLRVSYYIAGPSAIEEP